jgi:hypothetical protein
MSNSEQIPYEKCHYLEKDDVYSKYESLPRLQIDADWYKFKLIEEYVRNRRLIARKISDQ